MAEFFTALLIYEIVGVVVCYLLTRGRSADENPLSMMLDGDRLYLLAFCAAWPLLAVGLALKPLKNQAPLVDPTKAQPPSELIGKTGTAITPMLPMGKVRLDECQQIITAKSERGGIDKDQRVTVTRNRTGTYEVSAQR
ncbi:NfeD family protein [Cerasicoccus maritimus]|uniref:NfeD family protein n=1 Tax=Cerasicoccus maritimus TaxID=490089 RepID=UPI002852CABD|nr:NfeD family protein [Cerasicoccus maritimus]